MKLLIIAGPYEADRIRRAAASAGFEAVAVEPGESLSGWITASRPDVIVMAPQMVHPDPAQALAKVRSVPRGRVPTFLVGDAADEVRLAGLSEGVFVRPVSPEALLTRARTLAGQAGLGGRPRTAEGIALAPAVPAGNEFARSGQTPKSGGHPRGAAALKPLISASVPAALPRQSGSHELLAELDAGIDALLDAELGEVVAATTAIDIQVVGEAPAPGRATPPAANGSHPPRAEVAARALAELSANGDYFELLGIARDATGDDVRRAHARIVRELGPEVVGAQLAGELGPRLEVVRVVIDEAARVLGDDRLRARYAAALAEG
jgi:CheY-like chemotaxis protein